MATKFEADADTDEESQEDNPVAEINITPLTDIFLVLLVIFMVTSTVAIDAALGEARGVRVELPKASATGTVVHRDDPVLTITPDGKLFIGSKQIQETEVRVEVEKALQQASTTRLVIRADKNALFGRAVTVMGDARKGGAEQIAVQALETTPP